MGAWVSGGDQERTRGEERRDMRVWGLGFVVYALGFRAGEERL
jgi:hypothetical protein